MIGDHDDRLRQKKSRAASPAPKIVSTLFSRKFWIWCWLAGRRCFCAPGFLPRLGPPDFDLPASLSP